MTLPVTIPRVQGNGDGSTVSFTISFIFWDADDLDVVHTDSSGTETTWTRGTQFTVSGGSGSTGTLTVKTSPTDYTPASGETLTIKDGLPDSQPTAIATGGALDTAALEQQLDKIVRQVQQLAETLGRCPKYPVSDSSALSSQLPNSSDRASNFMAFDASGEPIASAGSADTVTVSTFMATVLDDTTAADARSTLGIGGGSTLGTNVATTSGTAVTFTGIPAGVLNITIMLDTVSTTGTSGMIVQLGDAGGIETSGYNGREMKQDSAGADGAVAQASTAGFVVDGVVVAANAYQAVITLSRRSTSHDWLGVSIAAGSGNFMAFSAASKQLTAELDRVSLTTVGGSDTFDGGNMNIIYE